MIIFLILNTIPQKEDIILLILGTIVSPNKILLICVHAQPFLYLCIHTDLHAMLVCLSM